MIQVDVLIFHGKPPEERYKDPDLSKPYEANWLPWISSELAKRGLRTAIPQFPEPYAPDFFAWKEEVQKYNITKNGIVIAHSAGAEFALRWLSEEQCISLKQLVLVAPWTDSNKKYGDFSDFTLDTGLKNRIGKILIINSLDDSGPIQKNTNRLRTKLKSVEYREFTDRGHFMLGNNMPDTSFTELLDEID